MTTYTFTPNLNDQSVNWNDPSVWIGGVVPNGPAADVIIPETTVIATGQPYVSDITISSAVSVHSISLTDNTLSLSPGSLSVSSLENAGTITVGLASYNGGSATLPPPNSVTIDGVVTGNGTLLIEPEVEYWAPLPGMFVPAEFEGATLELSEAASGAVVFSDTSGTLILNDPGGFVGTIAPVAGDRIILSGISLSSVIGESYSRVASSGVLTLQLSNGTINLSFVGPFDTTSFSLSVEPGQPSNLLISVDSLATTPNDLSGDGLSDMLWRNSSGSLAVWLMNGGEIASSPVPTFNGNAISPDSSWSVAGIGDFNDSGNYDILWRQSSTGSLAMWLMNGSTITSNPVPKTPPIVDGNFVFSFGEVISPDSSWSVAGLGHFYNRADVDILWRQNTGTLAEWMMNGSTIMSSAIPMFNGNAVSPDSSWSVAGIGDFNGDGVSDIFWRQSSTGSLTMWFMNGSTITSSASPTNNGNGVSPDASWSITGIGDFNGDGDADILWRQSTTASLSLWLMNGSTIKTSAAPTFQGSAVMPDSTWNIVEVGNFTGGNSNILWQQSTTGALIEWQMNGATITSSLSVTSQGLPVAPPSSWQNQAKPTDFA